MFPESILLFGPRGTGKSTWIHHHFNDAVIYDLLNTSELLRLSREPEALYREVESVPAERWIVIDEIQKVPALLDEVHRLIENKRQRFVLSGSSARKLRRGGRNLLAGRAIVQINFLQNCRGWAAPTNSRCFDLLKVGTAHLTPIVQKSTAAVVFQ